jgi:signal peptidase I
MGAPRPHGGADRRRGDHPPRARSLDGHVRGRHAHRHLRRRAGANGAANLRGTARTPARGDVIVSRYPREPDKDFIKRVVAVGGDTIELRDEELVLNGTPVARKHVDAPCEYDDDDYDGSERKRRCDAWDETLDGRTYRVIFDAERTPRPYAPVTVPPGSVYVLGDNRDNSHDSRYWGFVAGDLIKGTARTIWWSSGPGGVRWSRHGQRIR